VKKKKKEKKEVEEFPSPPPDKTQKREEEALALQRFPLFFQGFAGLISLSLLEKAGKNYLKLCSLEETGREKRRVTSVYGEREKEGEREKSN